jgi:uncharacterized protein
MTMTVWRLLAAALLTLGSMSPAFAQSFDCRKAQTRVEKMICADTKLSELDEHLSRYYNAGKAALPGAEACLQTDQTQWLKSVREPCPDRACLERAYLSRLGELDPLQPGVTAVRQITLPASPALVWIIPPALDKVAAPPNPKAKPFEATGRLVDGLATNPNDDHGFVLRTSDGAVYPLVLLMFLEGSTSEHLSLLAKEPGAISRARGHAVTDNGRLHFEPSRCVFIHRMPKG